MDLASCPFCGEQHNLSVWVDGTRSDIRVQCNVCRATGPCADHMDRDQAIANWNRRPTSTLSPATKLCPSCGHLHMVGPSGRTVCGDGAGNCLCAPGVVYETNTGVMLDSTGHNHVMRYTPPNRPTPASVETTDDLSKARERHELAGLPSLTTTADPDGLAMDFDLGGEPKKR